MYNYPLMCRHRYMAPLLLSHCTLPMDCNAIACIVRHSKKSVTSQPKFRLSLRQLPTGKENLPVSKCKKNLGQKIVKALQLAMWQRSISEMQ